MDEVTNWGRNEDDKLQVDSRYATTPPISRRTEFGDLVAFVWVLFATIGGFSSSEGEFGVEASKALGAREARARFPTS